MAPCSGVTTCTCSGDKAYAVLPSCDNTGAGSFRVPDCWQRMSCNNSFATVEQDSEACLDWFSTFRTLLVECRWFLVVQFSLRFQVLPTAMAFSAADTWANIALLIVGCLTIMTRHVVAAEECALCPVSAGAGQSPVSLSPSRALCIVQSGAILEGPITASQNASTGARACDDVDPILQQGPTESGGFQLYVQWNRMTQCVCLFWHAEQAQVASPMPALFLITTMHIEGMGQDAFLRSSVFATSNNYITLCNQGQLSLENSNYSVLALYSNGSARQHTVNTSIVPLSAPLNAVWDRVRYQANPVQAVRYLSWHPGDDTASANRLYNLHIEGVHDDSQGTTCKPVSVINYRGEVLAVRMLTDVDYDCTYNISISPVIFQLSGQPLASNVLSCLSLHGNASTRFGAAVPTSFAPVAKIHCGLLSDFNEAFNFSAAFIGSNLTVNLNLGAFNQSHLLLPLNDLLASLDFISLVVFRTPSLVPLFISDPINMYKANGTYSLVVHNPNFIAGNSFRVIVEIPVHLIDDIPHPVNGIRGVSTVTCTDSEDVSIPEALTTASTPSTPSGTSMSMSTSASPSVAGEASALFVPLIAVIVAPVIVLVAVGVLIAVLVVRYRKKESKEEHRKLSQVSNDTLISQVAGDALDEYEIHRGRLQLLDVVGSGAFGIVRQARLHDSTNWLEGGSRLVAVKMMHGKGNDSDRQELLAEINQMKGIGNHPNLIRLIGCCTIMDPVCLVAEWMPRGSLAQLLRRTKRLMMAEGPWDNSQLQMKVTKEGHIHEEEICHFGKQISSGMAHLATLRYVHRDLATRNILVGKNNEVKVADFGMTRDVYADPDGVYVKSGKGPAPLRWMAPEALLYREYSTPTDVWAFGVVLWEVCTYAALPYSDIINSQLRQHLEDGHRLRCPAGCPDQLYNIMRSCWSLDPNDRPSFTDLGFALTNFAEKLYESVEHQAPSTRPTFVFDSESSTYIGRNSDTDTAYTSGGSSVFTSNYNINSSGGSSSGLGTSLSGDSMYGLATSAGSSLNGSLGHRTLMPPVQFTRRAGTSTRPTRGDVLRSFGGGGCSMSDTSGESAFEASPSSSNLLQVPVPVPRLSLTRSTARDGNGNDVEETSNEVLRQPLRPSAGPDPIEEAMYLAVDDLILPASSLWQESSATT